MPAEWPADLIEADWPAPAGIRAVATTRGLPGASVAPYQRCNLGLRSGDVVEHVIHNRAALRPLLGLPSAPHWLHQVHGCEVLHLSEPAGEIDPTEAIAVVAEPMADASVTADAGVVLAVLSADCLPVLMCSDDGQEIAATHAGWRGLAAGVLENTVAAMSIAPERLLAWLGPAIGPDAYEVGDEVRSAFVDRDRMAAACFKATRPGHWQCDLYALARQRLQRVGVTQIYGGGLCTCSDAARFYSYRRDGADSGRQACLIWRDPVSEAAAARSR